MSLAWRFRISSWGRSRIRNRGSIDGAGGIPADSSQDPSAYELSLVQQCAQEIQTLNRQNIPSIQKTEAERQKKFALFKQYISAYVDYRVGYNQERQSSSATGHSRLVLRQVPRVMYTIVMLMIGFGEFALNAQAFDVFQQPKIDTFIMALTVAAGLPMTAHFVGMHVKQWQKGSIRGIVVPAFVVVSVVAALWGVNVARISTIETMSGVDPELFIPISKAFFFINAFIFVAAMYLSYSAHDENPQLDRACVKSNRLDRKIIRLDNQLNKLSGQLDAMRAEHEADINKAVAECKQMIFEYRGANELARGGTRPQAHTAQPNVTIPTELAHEVQEPVSERMIEHWREIWRGVRSSDSTTKPSLPRAGN